MGQGESQLAAVEGFQVARVVPRSPAHLAGLVPFFDLITAVDHRPLSGEAHDFFKSYLQKSSDTALTLTVFNLRVRGYRDVPLTPTLSWGGPGLLGCTIEWTSAERCLQNTWHVLDVFDNSPGSRCPEMAPQRTFILGMQLPSEESLTLLRDEHDFHSRMDSWRQVQTHQAQVHHSVPDDVISHVSILYLLYDDKENAVKEVVLPMSEQDPKTGLWRVATSVGLDVANGYLHVIPPSPTGELPVIRKFVVLSSQQQQGAVDLKETPLAATEKQAALLAFPEPPSAGVPMPASAITLDSPAVPPTPTPTPVSPPGNVAEVPATAAAQPTAAAEVRVPPSRPEPIPTFLPPPLKFPTFPAPQPSA